MITKAVNISLQTRTIRDHVELARKAATKHVKDCLARIKNDDEMGMFLMAYASFNRTAGPGVASLVHRCSIHDFFYDKHGCYSGKDRGWNVATFVFQALVDEFSVKKNHRQLAQEMVGAILQFDGKKPSDEFLVGSLHLYRESYGLIEECSGLLLDGYVNLPVMNALGFHAASETFADLEYNAIKDVLFRDHKFELLARHLIDSKAKKWIEAHTKIEDDHYGFAILAIDEALSFADPLDTEKMGDVVHGVDTFAEYHKKFFETVT